MISIRGMFATLMAVMVAGSMAQSSSSSSSSAGASSRSSSSAASSTGSMSSSSFVANISQSSSSSSGFVPNVTISSSSSMLANASSTGMGPIPGWNSSSSSSSWWSSSTGSDSPALYPFGTQEISYWIELANGVAPAGLADALVRDFAATIVNREPSFNVSAQALYDYIRIRVQDPATNQTQSSGRQLLQASTAKNTSVIAIILGNVTNVVTIGNAHDLAMTFYNAAAQGQVVIAASQALGVTFYPQQVVVIESPLAQSSTGSDGHNGASSVASASLLIGSMIAALVLAF